MSDLKKKFWSQITLFEHTRGVHDKIKPFQCLVCKKRFGFQGN
jgi:hypothetical protein